MSIVKATQRAKDPLRGAAAIGVQVGKVINRHRVGKHFITHHHHQRRLVLVSP